MEQRKILNANFVPSHPHTIVKNSKGFFIYEYHSAEISKFKIAMVSHVVDYAHTCSAFGDSSIAF